MQKPLYSLGTLERLENLYSYKILDTPYEEEFDNITKLAASICNAPYAVITIADEERLWFKSIYGMEAEQVPLTNSICGNTIKGKEQMLVIDDMTQFEGTKTNPLVTQNPYCVYYAGTKVFNHELVFGTLCIMDTEKRELNKEQLDALKVLGGQVSNLYKLRKKKIELMESKELLKKKIEELDQKTLLLEEVSKISPTFLYVKNLKTLKVEYSSGSLLNHVCVSIPQDSTCCHELFIDLLVKEDAEKLKKHYADLEHTPLSTTRTFEFRVKDENEVIKWFMSIDTPISKDENGKTKEIAGIITEITKHKTYQKQLEEKNKELEEFAYITSHDLLGPIQNLQVFIDLLIEQNIEQFDDQSIDFAKFIKGSALRMNSQIKELLDYAVIGKNRVKKEVNPAELIELVFSDLSNHFPTWKENVFIETNERIDVFETEFKLLIQNLIENAIKFAHPERQLQIGIFHSCIEGFHKFSFCDNGIGIKAEYREQVFRIFNQLDKAKDGIGMGLAQCKKIAQLHGGSIWIDASKTSGSCFHFTIQKNIGTNELLPSEETELKSQ